MISFVELREKANKDQVVKKFKSGKHNIEVMKAANGKFAVQINGDLLDSGFKNEKEASKAAKDFIKLVGEELEI